jgi:hypothetical protein
MSPHFDKILNHKSAIFVFSFDRDWLPEIWKGDAIWLDFSISRAERHFLPNIKFPLSDSLHLITDALENCAKHLQGEETFDFDERPMGFVVHGSSGNCEDCGWIFARGLITDKTAAKFEAFMSGGVFLGTKSGKVAVRLHSLGGSLRGALTLGRVFRKYGISTRVATLNFRSRMVFPSPKPKSVCRLAHTPSLEELTVRSLKTRSTVFTNSTGKTLSRSPQLRFYQRRITLKHSASSLSYLSMSKK